MITKADKKELDEALNKISDAKNVIEALACHYREKFDDLSEKAQEGERGSAIDEAASELETMNEALDEIISNGETNGLDRLLPPHFSRGDRAAKPDPLIHTDATISSAWIRRSMI